MNMLRTTILLAALTGLFLAIGYLVGGPVGLVIAFVLAALLNFFAYWSSDKLALRMAKAKEASLKDHPRLHSTVEEVADRIVRIIKDPRLRERLGHNARETVRGQFLETRLLEQYLDLFNSFETVYKLHYSPAIA